MSDLNRTATEWARSQRTVDLFSGCGGMSLGFQNAGYRICAAYDNWGYACELYSRNFDHPVYPFDLSDIKGAVEHIGQHHPDIVIGGPPCQDFSIAGKRIEDARANMTVAFAKIVGKLKPKMFVMENVYSIEGSDALSKACRVLRASGFSLSSRVIDASLARVPQRRHRYFLVGTLDKRSQQIARLLDAGLAQHPMSVRDEFGDSLDLDFYYAHPRSYKRRAVFSVDEPSATIRRVNRPIPATYVSHPADKAKVTRGLRPLTTSERARIQTFPSWYVFIGTKSQQEHAIANAVPVRLAQYVAEQAAIAHTAVTGGKRLRRPKD